MAVKLQIYSAIVLGLSLAGVASVTSQATADAALFPSGPDDDVRSLIDQLRAGFQQELADLKKEIADMRTKHGLEIEKQRVEFQDQLSPIRKECGERRGYQPNVDDAETDMLAGNPSIAIDPPRKLNGTHTGHALLKSPGKIKERKRSLPGQKRSGSTSPNVAFFARLMTTMHALGAGQHLIFDNVVTNVGNGYDKDIGVFRAPVSGTYLIAMTITQRDTWHFGIYINQNQLTWTNVAGNENNYGETSQTVIVHLDVGDDVTVRASDKGGHGAYGFDTNLFSGALLFDDGAAIIGK